jgi:hypothetical protein
VPTQVLHPGAVSLVHPGFGGHHPSSTVVGSPPQWDDGNDATYGHIHTNVSTTQRTNMWAPLDLLTESGTVVSVLGTYRVSMTTASSFGFLGPWSYDGVITSSGWTPGSLGSYGSIPGLTIANSAAGIVDITVDFSWAITMEPDFVPLLRSGAYLWFGFTQGFDYDLKVHEAYLTVELAAGGWKVGAI